MGEIKQQESSHVNIEYIFCTLLFFVANGLCMSFCEMLGAVKSKAILFSLVTSIIVTSFLYGVFVLFIKILEKITNKKIIVSLKHIILFIILLAVFLFVFAPIILALVL